jgi:SRSO17 transposase
MTADTGSSGLVPALDLSAQDVVALADELQAYHAEFSGLFFRQEQQQWALKYLAGLVQPEGGKSVERLALRVPGGNVRNMQQFIGEGAWDDATILEKHAALVAESLGEADGVLIVDGTDFPKKGKHSVGVARQYCGATGKVDNCQAAVFVAYASRHGHTLLDRRLYLPKDWFEPASRTRWERCGIPEGTSFRTKLELAWEMIEKGPIRARFAFVRVVAARDQRPGPDLWVVFRRSMSDPSELKMFLSNAPVETPKAELVRLSGMRWPIQTCFEEAKGNLGMAQYQTRSWRGWHHRMTLVILAHHFLVRLKLRHKKGHRR